ncbi:hypothetical protein [Lamprobacter modestohalophilus]|uniref:hypothetical protein n=1 Tax=Lamprobacter modestohalophilus TaxID=1064514 RepID=UPI00190796BD|nr:hypothetical protein [Lamprobacter modestohalophilus]MCF7993658.1 hypothetical protein [Chromatiaceae bacterium]
MRTLLDPTNDYLRAINLLSYKSRHETLGVWSLDELIGYYVLYRKVNLDAEQARHPRDAFGLYAVATRYPKGLARSHGLQPTACASPTKTAAGHCSNDCTSSSNARHPRWPTPCKTSSARPMNW